jgi:hypothetical protein
VREREAAWIVIKENEKEKEKRMQEKENDKLVAQRLQEDYAKEIEKKDQKRADEWAAREAKIQ